ncbi:MAG: hypothetical protein OWQ48_04200 [Desulfurococcus sp.]|nr:hypothetical protein [Desulfurococcus sp.]
MASGVRVLLGNLWFPTREEVVKGYIFVENGRVGFTGSSIEPEHELSELQYDFQGWGLALHGFSAIVDIVEFPLRMLGVKDTSILSRSEVEMLAEAGFANAIASGVTMPIAFTRHAEVVLSVARRLGVKVAVVSSRGVLSDTTGYIFELENSVLSFRDSVLGYYSDVVCTPRSLKPSCRILDLRGAGSTLQVLAAFIDSMDSRGFYRLLTEPYRITGESTGFIEAGSPADIQVVDLRNPLKASIIESEAGYWSTLSRFMPPDIVLVNGEVVYEKGEHIAVVLKDLTRILEKLQSR